MFLLLRQLKMPENHVKSLLTMQEKVCRVKSHLADPGEVKPDDELLHRLKEHYGEQGVSLSY